MDAHSEATLKTVVPALAEKVRAAASVLEAQGTFLCVYSGLRTAQQQNGLYAQGRTAAGHVVTNARAGQSMHNYGFAVDVVPYLSGAAGVLNWHTVTPQFTAMVHALKAQGLEWGGDWVHFKDMDHFQLGGLPANPSPSMCATYKDGSEACIHALWAKVVTGAFNVEPGSGLHIEGSSIDLEFGD